MKRFTIFFVAVVFATAWTSPVSAGDREDILKLASKNLKITLGKPSNMIRESAILAVLDIKNTYPGQKMNEVILPLMNILRTDEDPNIRLLAALALYEVGDGRALFAIREAVRFDSNHIVRHVCASMYNEACM